MNSTQHISGLPTKFTLFLLSTGMALLLATSGCSQSKQKTQLRNKAFRGSPTMKQILQNRHRNPSRAPQPDYRQSPDWSARKPSAVESGGYRTALYIPAGDANNEDYTRTERNELSGLFPRLPNPDLCMYVMPHLTSEKATVPGYTSCFPLYETNQYALPGEMSAIWQQR